MTEEKKKGSGIADYAGAFVGDFMSQNSHNATDAMIEGMDLFRNKAGSVANVGFDQAKGNLFEYIEAAKFNADASMKNAEVKAFVTDALGDPHAAADILIKKGNKTVQEVQAKVSETFKDGRPSSASDSVAYQAGAQSGHWGKYHGMQRLIRKDENYNSEGSLLDEAKKIAKARGDSNGIYADEYKDVYENLTDELQYEDVKSGGTTIEELRDAYDDPKKYSQSLEYRQLAVDIVNTSKNMAKAGAVSNGIVSGVKNTFLFLKDEKELGEALKDIGVDTVKGGIRGGVTGALSTSVRYAGSKAGIGILSDSSAAAAIAGGMIDGGVAVYSYARGEITGEELQKQLVDTTVKSVSTVYFTKAIGVALGVSNPFIPMAVYTAASCVVSCIRSVIENAKLNAAEYERIRCLLDESTELIEQYRVELNRFMESCEKKQRDAMEVLLNSFDYNLETGENYDQAIYSIVQFAECTGMELQHADFSEFKDTMNSGNGFVLKRKRR